MRACLTNCPPAPVPPAARGGHSCSTPCQGDSTIPANDAWVNAANDSSGETSLSPARPSKAEAPERRVLLLTFDDGTPLGERLGWALVQEILPPGVVLVRVRLIDAAGLDFGKYDLVLVGCGGYLPCTLVTPELVNLVSGVRSVGLFGIRREMPFDAAPLSALLDRLTVWLVPTREEQVLYASARANAIWTGDMRICLLPGVETQHEREVRVSGADLAAASLADATVTIASHHAVSSDHPDVLLMAMRGARSLAWSTKEADWSAELRGLFLDVFGRSWPAEVWFEVDPEAVTAYRVLTDALLEKARAVIRVLLKWEAAP